MKNIRLSTVLIVIFWLAGLFLRTYRQKDLLGFYYDQGCDAQIASDIIHLRNLPAIGPTTGIPGLHLGPFWFYLLAPFYFIGSGSPVIASYFISFIDSLSIILLYLILKKYHSASAGLVGAATYSFSRYLISSSRWFSNPSPLPFFTLLAIYLTLEVFSQKKFNRLPLLSLVLGLSLQLEAASAIFFYLSLGAYTVLQLSTAKAIPLKYYRNAFGVFIVLLIPQFAFELKNNYPTLKTLMLFTTGRVASSGTPSWSIPNINFIQNRLLTYYQYLFSKFDVSVSIYSTIALMVFLFGLVLLLKRQSDQPLVRLTCVWLIVPLTLLLFFSGNYGRLYDYYLTGFYPSFVIIVSLILFLPSKIISKTVLILLFFVYFIFGNEVHLYHYLTDGIDGPTNVVFGNQFAAVSKLCSMPEDYRLDIYVPPITPLSYDYLFDWLSSTGCRRPSSSGPLLLLYETDLVNPGSLQKWLSKQPNRLPVAKFGGVTIEKVK